MVRPFLFICWAISYSVAASDAVAVSSSRALLQEAGFSAADITGVLDRGELRKHIMESSNKREIGMAFATLVQTSPENIMETFLSLRLKKKLDPDVYDTGIISSQDSSTYSLADFDKVVPSGKLGDKLVKELLESSPGSDWNLSRDEIADFNAGKETKSAGNDASSSSRQRVEKSLHEMLLRRFQSYREKGIGAGGIVPYARKKGADYNAGDDLRMSLDWARLLRKSAPKFFQHLMDYPKQRPPEDGIQESFSWFTFLVEGKLDMALAHRMAGKEEDKFIFSERQFYVMNGYNCLQAIGCAIPLENKGTLVLFSSRTSTDAVTGFGGSAKRAIGVRMMGSIVSSVLNRYRAEEKSGLSGNNNGEL